MDKKEKEKEKFSLKYFQERFKKNYSERFKKECKELLPDNEDLHHSLDIGSLMVGKYLSDSKKKHEKELEKLEKINTLYLEWVFTSTNGKRFF